MVNLSDYKETDKMKIIISHDIDHYFWSDHLFKDLFIPKFVVKNTMYLASGKITFSVWKARLSSLLSNRFGRLEEMTEFNHKQGIPVSYFMGVRNALNLSYSLKTAKYIAGYLEKMNYPLYLHGISYDDSQQMQIEKEAFLQVVNPAMLGIRMHYLRNTPDTFNILASLDYAFDSTEYGLKNPYYIGNMLEFPVSMMEVYMMDYHDSDLEKIKERTLQRIQDAEKNGLKYFTVIFHDHHYDMAFPLHKLWYEWLIGYFKNKGYAFVNFKESIDAIRSESYA
jgi:hypothetical protein